MKKIILSSFVILNLFFNIAFVNAYSFGEFESQKAKYSILIKDKLSAKLDSFSEEETKILFDVIVKRINVFEKENNLEDTRKFNELVIYYALKDYLAENIADFQNKLTITVIDDRRCTNCQTDAIIGQLEQIPFISTATMEKKDFSDEGVSEYLNENNIKFLPAIIYSTNDIEDNDMKSYLIELESGEYSLTIGSQFDPFAERSDKGFLLLDKEKLQEIKSDSYIRGNVDAKITWLEYSDLECPFCAMFHKGTVDEDITEKYGENLNKVFNHFPLNFHQNAMPGAQILECVGEQLGGDAFYNLIDISYASAKQLQNGNINTKESSSKDFLIEEAVKLGANKEALESCLNDDTYKSKVTTQMNNGSLEFGITGTPGSVLINNETGEYEVISGALPYEFFESAIDNLLK